MGLPHNEQEFFGSCRKFFGFGVGFTVLGVLVGFVGAPTHELTLRFPAPNAETKGPVSVINGWVAPNHGVAVDLDGLRVGTIIPMRNGVWEMNKPIDPGTHELTLTELDDDNIPVGTAKKYKITIVGGSGSPPEVFNLGSNAEMGVGSFVLKGSAKPGDTIIVASQTGDQLGWANVNSEGRWNVKITVDEQISLIKVFVKADPQRVTTISGLVITREKQQP